MTDRPPRPLSLTDTAAHLGPCDACDDTGWVWDSGPFGQNKGSWRFCKACKWRRS